MGDAFGTQMNATSAGSLLPYMYLLQAVGGLFYLSLTYWQLLVLNKRCCGHKLLGESHRATIQVQIDHLLLLLSRGRIMI